MASSISSGSSGKLSLSEKEMQLSPWQQMMVNGAVNQKHVSILESKDSSIMEDDSDLDDYFSDGELSVGSNIAVPHAHHSTVLELREYQKELAANALQGKNTIILAPTGSGKTRVATHIIMEHFKQSEGQKKKRVAFLAKTVPLAVQQYKSLCKYLPRLEIASITGQSEETMCLNILLKYIDIIVMTPQILENHLKENLLSNLGVFSMLIFDECHHTRKKDPYNVLMISYLKMKDQIRLAKQNDKKVKFRLPQIIGLTATIGVDKAVETETATKNILEICGNLDVSSLSTIQVNKEELKRVVPVPREVFIHLRERENDESVSSIHQIMKKLEDQLKHYADELRATDFCLEILRQSPLDRKGQIYEQWAVEAKEKAKQVAIRDLLRETNMPVRLSIIILEYLLVYRAALETYDLVELGDVIDYMERCLLDFRNEDCTIGEKTIFAYFEELKRLVQRRHCEENPNLHILTRTLKKYLTTRGSQSRGIIFVRTRALAEALSAWLNRCGITDLQNLNACSFTGSNASADKGGTTQVQQEAIVQRFRSGDIRLLVATSVAEEGLDIPECNLVIKYNHIGNEITVVQTRGRSRAFGGVSVLLAMGRILQRERINHARVKLMKEAIKKIQKMKPEEFGKIVEKHQKQILEDAKIAELAAMSKKKQYRSVPFRMVCVLCRKVAIDGSNVRVIAGSHHISVDRNLLDHIKVVPRKEPKQTGGCLLIGKVKCKGEPEPGSKCNKKLGEIVKHKQIPFVALGIKNFAFDLGDQQNLETFRKWKDVYFHIGGINFDDFERYLEDERVHLINQNDENDQSEEASTDDSSNDDDDDDDDDSDN